MAVQNLGIKTILPAGTILKEGDEADLRVVMQDGALVVTKVLRHSAGSNAADYKVKLGAFNRK